MSHTFYGASLNSVNNHHQIYLPTSGALPCSLQMTNEISRYCLFGKEFIIFHKTLLVLMVNPSARVSNSLWRSQRWDFDTRGEMKRTQEGTGTGRGRRAVGTPLGVVGFVCWQGPDSASSMGPTGVPGWCGAVGPELGSTLCPLRVRKEEEVGLLLIFQAGHRTQKGISPFKLPPCPCYGVLCVCGLFFFSLSLSVSRLHFFLLPSPVSSDHRWNHF